MNDQLRVIHRASLQRVIDYLQTCPYKDVADLISELINGSTPFVQTQTFANIPDQNIAQQQEE